MAITMNTTQPSSDIRQDPSYRAFSELPANQRIRERWWRQRWSYVATKALTDWELLSMADPRGKRILNVGCSEPIDEFLYAGIAGHWTTIDFVEAQLQTASRVLDEDLAPARRSGVSLCTANAVRLPFADATFDIALAFSTIEHIPDPDDRHQAIRELARVTRPGGHVIITLPNLFSLAPLAHVYWQLTGQANYGFVRSYAPFQLRRQLRQAGLKLLRFTSEYKLPTWPHFMNLLPMRFGMRMGYLAQKR
ncbi:MAG: hypothetical protein A2498_07665 [Lentisphaerae bacterium RIFOXYC12_FULL_60_16]|nr:MAG: hypothetical protein A2498_07665 [Lentisphaerae bacterium RIFOXYC12_FULL_60_16]OGV83532.1 MAG: hypothetical protein A2340_10495 [Lentisphaerae bacterium RIFOXYB12_FULL_60_10]